MSVLLTRGTRLSQPPGPVEIDWGNPIARGLRRAFVGDSKKPREVVGGALITDSWNSSLVPLFTGKNGKAIRHSLSPYSNGQTVYLPSWVNTTNQGSYVILQHRVAATGNNDHWMHTGTDPNGQHFPWNGDVVCGHYWNNRWLVAAPPAGKSFNTPHVIAASVKDGSQRIFWDGVLFGSNNLTGGFSIRPEINLLGDSSDIAIYVAMFFERALTDAEIASISANPWQLFKPVQRRVWFDGSASGGGITLTPPLLTNTSDLFTPTITTTGGTQDLTPPLLTNSSTLYAPSTTLGAISVAPPLLTNTSDLFAPTVIAGGTVVQPPLLTNTSDLFGPSVTPGAVSVAPPLLPSSNAFFAPIVSVGGTVLQAPLLENTSTLHTPTVGLGAIALGPPLLTNTSTLYAPTVAATGPQTLEPPLLTNTSTLFAPVVGDVQALSNAEMRQMYEMVQSIYAAVVTNAPLDVNLVRVRGQVIGGTGTASDPWGP